MYINLNIPILKYEMLDQKLEVKDFCVIPYWIKRGQDCYYCKFPLHSIEFKVSHIVVADIENIGISCFHQNCWNRLIKGD